MSASEQPLVDQVMRQLRITWDDETTKAHVENDLIPRAKSVLAYRIGLPDDFDFSQPGAENELLVSYCFYAWNRAEDDFYENYRRRLDETRRKWEVAQYVEEKESSDIP